MSDSGTGFHCAIGILATRYQRTITEKGQQVQVAMQDAEIDYIRPDFVCKPVMGEATERIGNEQPIAPVAPRGLYPASPRAE